MDKEWYQLWGRINAHEFLIENLYALAILKDADPLASARATAEKATRLVSEASAPGSDPAIGDAMSAATEDAIKDIMQKITTRVEYALR